jgi:formylglycine-generating enzyme required for sulfatase activity
LPSEAEWEYAAAGGNEQREYPWGSTPPGTTNQYAIYNGIYAGIAPVGTASMGVGKWQQLDLAGDVWEWNLDWYANPYVDPCINCADLSPESFRVIRGGGANSNAAYLLPPYRSYVDPSLRSGVNGLRCARAP